MMDRETVVSLLCRHRSSSSSSSNGLSKMRGATAKTKKYKRNKKRIGKATDVIFSFLLIVVISKAQRKTKK